MNEAENLVFYAAQLPWHVRPGRCLGEWDVCAEGRVVAHCAGRDSADLIVAAVAAFDPATDTDTLRRRISDLEAEQEGAKDERRAYEERIDALDEECQQACSERNEAAIERDAALDRVAELETALEREDER